MVLKPQRGRRLNASLPDAVPPPRSKSGANPGAFGMRRSRADEQTFRVP